jgi:senataxin
VADASALAALFGKSGGQRSAWTHLLETSQDDYDETDCETDLVGDAKDWVSFQKVSDAVGENSENWSCVPLLWMEVLEGGVPHQYPPSFCKAVLWAVAQLAVVDLPAGDCICFPKICLS